MPVQPRIALIGRGEAGEQLDRRGFARAVDAEQRDHFPFFYVKRQPVQRDHVAVTLGEGLGLNGVHLRSLPYQKAR